MPRRWQTPVRLLLPVVALGCATLPPEPVELIGARAELATLHGRWTGSYEADAYDRHGFIEMTIFAAADSARGDVLMTYQPRNQPIYDPAAVPPGTRIEQQLLAIRFVRAADGVISGMMVPYRDPQCGCRLATTFTGRLEGDVISGTYQTRHLDDDHPGTTGRWRVARQKTAG